MRAEDPRSGRPAGAAAFPALGACLLVAVAISLALGAGSAAAALSDGDPWGGHRCPSGEGAAQCNTPRGVGADPENGHLFVADQVNRRVQEFNALGQFVKAWGWDVQPGGGAGLETCTAATGCKTGVSGASTGQFAVSVGVAVDSAGAVYLLDVTNRRVQKFNRKGEFVLMFGGEVNKTKVEEGTASEAEENLCPFDPGDVCKVGVQGSTGKGRFGLLGIGDTIAIDRSGAEERVVVGDNERIQLFDTGGNYLEDWPDSEGALAGKRIQGLATGPAGDFYAIYNNEEGVRKLTPAGKETTVFELPELVAFSAPLPKAVTVDSEGNVYAFGPTNPGTPTDPIFKFAPTGGAPIEQFGKGEFDGSTGLEANLCPGSEAPGNLYVANTSSPNAFIRAYGTEPVGCFKARTGEADPIAETSATLNGTVNPKGEAVSECRFEYGTSDEYGEEAPCAEEGAIGEGEDPVPVSAAIAGLTKGTVYHFRLLAKVGGEAETGSDAIFKTLGPPVVSEAQVLEATDIQATLRALVNPEGFATSYRFEYGPTAAYGQSTEAIPVGADRSEHAAQAVLEGLQPGATYHWRILATNSSGEDESEDRDLITYPSFAPGAGCENQALRSGPSAPLPDCRAYEMVSPVDKNGGDITNRGSSANDPGGYMQATPGGEKITYTSPASFAGQPASFAFNQYLAERGGGGWANEGVHPPVEGDPFGGGLNRSFIAFSHDLCGTWLLDSQTPPPSADGQEGFPNLYRRENCGPGAGSLEALVPAPPTLPEGTVLNYVTSRSVGGISGDGRHALFVAQAQLPHVPEAAVGGNSQLYDRFEGDLSLVSVMPDGSAGDPGPGDGIGFANPNHSVLGSDWDDANLAGAVAEDGSRVYWTDGLKFGTIYLREHPEQGIVAGECDEAGLNACTTKVSGSIGNAFFWQGSADGSRALFSEPNLSGTEDLFVFELDGKPPRTKIAADVTGVLGASEDLSRVYFASRAAIAGTAGKAGEPNVYLYEAGEGGPTYELVATVGEGDVGALEPEPGASFPAYDLDGEGTFYRATRVSPDGAHLAFNSRAPLEDGYDNTDTATGKPAVEVYLYDTTAKGGAGELHCASCNPSRARPKGREMSEPYNPGNLRNKVIAGAWIPTWEHPNYASNVLSEEGTRLFFNAADALVPRDSNGAQDVYQWEAPGSGGCTASSPSYFPQNGGCIDLISSGQSPFESEFWEASASGDDVFFTTASRLVSADPGQVDLYDARVGGGFPQPTKPAECEGEACAPPAAAPDFSTPSSATYSGPGEATPKAARRRCPKGKRRVRRAGRVRCVKRRARAGQKRRARR